MRVVFSMFFFAFRDRLTFSANSPPFVLMCDTCFLISIFVSKNRFNPSSVIVATMIMKSGRM